MLKVMTNNHRFLKLPGRDGLEVVFINGHAKDVIMKCSELIYEGWQLAADPLAGYFSRPNPYHTVFLQKGGEARIRGEDLIRLDRTLEQWDRYDNVIPVTDRLLKDYCELDFSIACSTMDGLIKIPGLTDKYYKRGY